MRIKVHNWDNLSGFEEEPIAAVIGHFDGIHIGHKKLLDTILKSSLRKIVITFRFKDIGKVDSIFTFEERLEMLANYGFKEVIVIDFSDKFSKLSSEVFFSQLRTFFNITDLYVGSDFACGYKRKDSAYDLVDMLSFYNVHIVEVIKDKDVKISSSCIRDYIKEGNIEEASSLLVYPYFFKIYGDVHDNEIEVSGNKIIPKSGKYLTVIEDDLGNSFEEYTLVGENYLKINNKYNFVLKKIEFLAKL